MAALNRKDGSVLTTVTLVGLPGIRVRTDMEYLKGHLYLLIGSWTDRHQHAAARWHTQPGRSPGRAPSATSIISPTTPGASCLSESMGDHCGKDVDLHLRASFWGHRYRGWYWRCMPDSDISSNYYTSRQIMYLRKEMPRKNISQKRKRVEYPTYTKLYPICCDIC